MLRAVAVCRCPVSCRVGILIFTSFLTLLCTGTIVSVGKAVGPVPPQLRRHGIVVAVSPPGADVGRDILQRGGNAVDAAIATAFAMAVTYPAAGNIGGGGFM